MCAIAGFYDSYLNASESSSLLRNMLESMKHRGPDATGMFINERIAMGHNRLSIIDLAIHSNQPFIYQNTILSFNGEIYNYLELKQELLMLGFQFTTHSDTEVLAASYIHWGEACVQHFIGMWAFAIYDTVKQSLFCSRDRFGIKPFSYIHSGTRFYFASETKALKKSPLFKPTLNQNHIARAINLGWIIYKDETFFEDILNLEAGHNLVFDGKNLRIYKYWELNLSSKFIGSSEEKQFRFRELFKDSVSLQLRSDVKVGTCLSGGIDSSSILSTICHLNEKQSVDAFTIYYDAQNSVDERPWAGKIIEKYPQINWHTFTPTNDEVMEAFEQIHYFADTPTDGSSHLSQHFVMKLAAQNKVKVLLDGQGSDEYLAGYMHAFDRLVGHQISQFKLIETIKSVYWHQKRHQLNMSELAFLMMKGLISSVSDEQKFYSYAYKNKVAQVINTPESKIPFKLNGVSYENRFDHYLYQQVFAATLPTLLHFEDRNSMTYGIESRVPFLDHRLVEFGFSLSETDKIKNGETKKILRTAMDGILPEAIQNRQDKKGFVTPGENSWMRNSLKQMVKVNFSDYDFIDQAKAKAEVANYLKGASNGKLVWRLISLNYWLRGI